MGIIQSRGIDNRSVAQALDEKRRQRRDDEQEAREQRAREQRPLFVYLALTCAHAPLQAPSAFLEAQPPGGGAYYDDADTEEAQSGRGGADTEEEGGGIGAPRGQPRAAVLPPEGGGAESVRHSGGGGDGDDSLDGGDDDGPIYHDRRLYNAMMSALDANVGRVVDSLKGTFQHAGGSDSSEYESLWANTILVFLSDNGGPLYWNNESVTGISDWQVRTHFLGTGRLISFRSCPSATR